MARLLVLLLLLLSPIGCTVDRFAGLMVRSQNHGRELADLRERDNERWREGPFEVQDPESLGWTLRHYDLPQAGIGCSVLIMEPLDRKYRIRKPPPRYQRPKSWAKRTPKADEFWQRRYKKRRQEAMRDLNESQVTIQPAENTVIVLAGIGAGKWATLPVLASFTNRGFRAIGVDLRGTGAASGDWHTYGVREATDLRELIASLRQDGWVEGKLVLYGMSFGGAVALMAAADEFAGTEADADLLIALAPFADLQRVVPHFARAQFGWWMMFYSRRFMADVIRRAAEMAEFRPDAARPVGVAEHIDIPVLLIHGERDVHVPVQHSRELAAALGSQAELIEVPEADHLGLLTDFIRLQPLVFGWLDGHGVPPSVQSDD